MFVYTNLELIWIDELGEFMSCFSCFSTEYNTYALPLPVLPSNDIPDAIAIRPFDTRPNKTNSLSKKEKEMSTELMTQRHYLNDRLVRVRYNFSENAQKKFNLRDDPTPKTRKEFADRIAAGKFVIDGLEKNPDGRINVYYANDFIRWRDPAMKEDLKGYDAAMASFNEKSKPVRDAIEILDPKDALKILQEFETSVMN